MSLVAAPFSYSSPFAKGNLVGPSASFSRTAAADHGSNLDLGALVEARPVIGDLFLENANLTFDSGTVRDSLGFSPVTSTASPTSTALISPKSSIADIASSSLPFPSNQGDADPTEVLSNHHLQRYLHYRGLAAQAEADAQATAQQNQQIDALFAAFSMPQPVGEKHIYTYPPAGSTNMLAYQYPPAFGQQFGFGQSQPSWEPSFNFQPQQASTYVNAQAEAQRQIHDMAVLRAQQQRSLSMTGYPSLDRLSFDGSQQASFWSRQSVSVVESPPFPSTPIYTGSGPVPNPSMAFASVVPGVPAFAAPIPSPTDRISPMAKAPSVSSPDCRIDGDETGRGDSEDTEDSDEVELKPYIPDTPVPNQHGGGRGYVPGTTPDDPKKRHKCRVCGRGFARAFNLKSHIQTHNPLRPKPHQCPHHNCKRGFSRLHDLERHRQGIHCDGPLVDAKRQGVLPSVTRAQSRISKRNTFRDLK